MASAVQRLTTAGLAAVAVWSLLLALAAMAGLGGRYDLHADDPDLVPALPELNLSQAQSRLDGLPAYAEVSDRPLFNEDRRPLPPPENTDAATEEEQPPPPAPLEVVVTSIILSGDIQIALVQNPNDNTTQSVRVGNELEGELSGWKLVEIEPRRVVFEGPGGRKSLDLRVFDGTGGQPPTAVDAPPPEMVVEETDGDGTEEKPQDLREQLRGQTPENRAELIRRRIEERRRQMREEAERARQERDNG